MVSGGEKIRLQTRDFRTDRCTNVLGRTKLKLRNCPQKSIRS